jgi:HK97 family phage prohead protease
MSSSNKNSDIQYKAAPQGMVNLDEAQGIVECFVAGIGNKDSVGDVCAPGAFGKSLTRRKPRVVWGHNWNDPIGKVIDMYEVQPNDPRLPAKMKAAGIGGLYARVQFNLMSEKGREAFANVAFFGEEQEWSIGYKTINAKFDPQMQANILYEVELYEVSPVLHGANQLTGTISVKSEEQPSGVSVIEAPSIDSLNVSELSSILDALKSIASSVSEDEKCGPGVMPQGMPSGGPGMPSVPKPMSMPSPGAAPREVVKPQVPSMPENPMTVAIRRELATRTGSNIIVRSASDSVVVFDRILTDGTSSTYKLPFHYAGGEFMFGKPEKVQSQSSYVQDSPMSEQVIEALITGAPLGFGKSLISFDDQEWGEGFGQSIPAPQVDASTLNSVIANLQKIIEEKSEYIVEVSPEQAFEVKQAIDPILDFYKVDATINENGIVVKSLNEEFLSALDIATKGVLRSLGNAIGRGVDRPNIGRNRGSRGSNLASRGPGIGSRGAVVKLRDGSTWDPKNAPDRNRNGIVGEGLFDSSGRSLAQPDPTPEGPDSVRGTNTPKAPKAPERLSSGRRRLPSDSGDWDDRLEPEERARQMGREWMGGPSRYPSRPRRESTATYTGEGLTPDERKEILDSVKGSSNPLVQKLLADMENNGRLSDKQWEVLSNEFKKNKKKTRPGYVSDVRGGGTVAPGAKLGGGNVDLVPDHENDTDYENLRDAIDKAMSANQMIRFDYSGKNREIIPVKIEKNNKTGKWNLTGQDNTGARKLFSLDKMSPFTGDRFSSGAWEKTEDGSTLDAPAIDGEYRVGKGDDGNFYVTVTDDAVRNGGQNAREYEHDEAFSTAAAAKRWAEQDYARLVEDMGNDTDAFEEYDYQEFSSGDRFSSGKVDFDKIGESGLREMRHVERNPLRYDTQAEKDARAAYEKTVANFRANNGFFREVPMYGNDQKWRGEEWFRGREMAENISTLRFGDPIDQMPFFDKPGKPSKREFFERTTALDYKSWYMVKVPGMTQELDRMLSSDNYSEEYKEGLLEGMRTFFYVNRPNLQYAPKDTQAQYEEWLQRSGLGWKGRYSNTGPKFEDLDDTGRFSSGGKRGSKKNVTRSYENPEDLKEDMFMNLIFGGDRRRIKDMTAEDLAYELNTNAEQIDVHLDEVKKNVLSTMDDYDEYLSSLPQPTDEEMQEALQAMYEADLAKDFAHAQTVKDKFAGMTDSEAEDYIEWLDGETWRDRDDRFSSGSFGFTPAGKYFDEIQTERGRVEWDDLEENEQIEFVALTEEDFIYDRMGFGDDAGIDALESGEYAEETMEYAQEWYEKVLAAEDAKSSTQESRTTKFYKDMAARNAILEQMTPEELQDYAEYQQSENNDIRFSSGSANRPKSTKTGEEFISRSYGLHNFFIYDPEDDFENIDKSIVDSLLKNDRMSVDEILAEMEGEDGPNLSGEALVRRTDHMGANARRVAEAVANNTSVKPSLANQKAGREDILHFRYNDRQRSIYPETFATSKKGIGYFVGWDETADDGKGAYRSFNVDKIQGLISSAIPPHVDRAARSAPSWKMDDFSDEDNAKILSEMRGTQEFRDLIEAQDVIDGYLAKGIARVADSFPDVAEREAQKAFQDARDKRIDKMVADGTINPIKRADRFSSGRSKARGNRGDGKGRGRQWSAEDRQRFADGNVLRAQTRPGKRRQGPSASEFSSGDRFSSGSVYYYLQSDDFRGRAVEWEEDGNPYEVGHTIDRNIESDENIASLFDSSEQETMAQYGDEAIYYGNDSRGMYDPQNDFEAPIYDDEHSPEDGSAHVGKAVSVTDEGGNKLYGVVLSGNEPEYDIDGPDEEGYGGGPGVSRHGGMVILATHDTDGNKLDKPLVVESTFGTEGIPVTNASDELTLSGPRINVSKGKVSEETLDEAQKLYKELDPFANGSAQQYDREYYNRISSSRLSSGGKFTLAGESDSRLNRRLSSGEVKGPPPSSSSNYDRKRQVEATMAAFHSEPGTAVISSDATGVLGPVPKGKDSHILNPAAAKRIIDNPDMEYSADNGWPVDAGRLLDFIEVNEPDAIVTLRQLGEIEETSQSGEIKKISRAQRIASILGVPESAAQDMLDGKPTYIASSTAADMFDMLARSKEYTGTVGGLNDVARVWGFDGAPKWVRHSDVATPEFDLDENDMVTWSSVKWEGLSRAEFDAEVKRGANPPEPVYVSPVEFFNGDAIASNPKWDARGGSFRNPTVDADFVAKAEKTKKSDALEKSRAASQARVGDMKSRADSEFISEWRNQRKITPLQLMDVLGLEKESQDGKMTKNDIRKFLAEVNKLKEEANRGIPEGNGLVLANMKEDGSFSSSLEEETPKKAITDEVMNALVFSGRFNSMREALAPLGDPRLDSLAAEFDSRMFTDAAFIRVKNRLLEMGVSPEDTKKIYTKAMTATTGRKTSIVARAAEGRVSIKGTISDTGMLGDEKISEIVDVVNEALAGMGMGSIDKDEVFPKDANGGFINNLRVNVPGSTRLSSGQRFVPRTTASRRASAASEAAARRATDRPRFSSGQTAKPLRDENGRIVPSAMLELTLSGIKPKSVIQSNTGGQNIEDFEKAVKIRAQIAEMFNRNTGGRRAQGFSVYDMQDDMIKAGFSEEEAEELVDKIVDLDDYIDEIETMFSEANDVIENSMEEIEDSLEKIDRLKKEREDLVKRYGEEDGQSLLEAIDEKIANAMKKVDNAYQVGLGNDANRIGTLYPETQQILRDNPAWNNTPSPMEFAQTMSRRLVSVEAAIAKAGGVKKAVPVTGIDFGVPEGTRLSSGKSDEYFQNLTSHLIGLIEKSQKEGGKWEAPWHKAGNLPKNASTKNMYSGGNLFALMLAAQEKGYTTPNWAGFQQWKSLGGTVRKGEKATVILMPKPLFGEEIDPNTGQKRRVSRGVYFVTGNVFNLDQIEGIDKEKFLQSPVDTMTPEQRVGKLEQAIAEVGAEIRTGDGSRAYYSPREDHVVMPPFELFKSPEGYYGTLAHELVHWTGHTSRLDRKNMNQFGSPDYAREELVAEFGSAFLLAMFGLSAEPREDHAHYLANWLKVLRDEPNALQEASLKAQEASKLLIGKMQAVLAEMGDSTSDVESEIEAKTSGILNDPFYFVKEENVQWSKNPINVPYFIKSLTETEDVSSFVNRSLERVAETAMFLSKITKKNYE